MNCVSLVKVFFIVFVSTSTCNVGYESNINWKWCLQIIFLISRTYATFKTCTISVDILRIQLLFSTLPLLSLSVCMRCLSAFFLYRILFMLHLCIFGMKYRVADLQDHFWSFSNVASELFCTAFQAFGISLIMQIFARLCYYNMSTCSLFVREVWANAKCKYK